MASMYNKQSSQKLPVVSSSLNVNTITGKEIILVCHFNSQILQFYPDLPSITVIYPPFLQPLLRQSWFELSFSFLTGVGITSLMIMHLNLLFTTEPVGFFIEESFLSVCFNISADVHNGFEDLLWLYL